MNLLEVLKNEFLEAEKRFVDLAKKKVEKCEDLGKHDVSGGRLNYIRGTIYGMSQCAVGIKVYGVCPNCGESYERHPTRNEMKSQKYRDLVKGLDTPKKIWRRMNTPLMI